MSTPGHGNCFPHHRWRRRQHLLPPKGGDVTRGSPTRQARGQGMTEYIIITALIAVAAIGIISLFGDNIRKLFGASAQALAGSNNVANTGDQQRRDRLEKKSLSNFGQNSY